MSDKNVSSKKSSNFFTRGLRKTRDILTADISDLMPSTRSLGPEALEEIETRLLMADLGIETTQHVVDELSKQAELGKLNNTDDLLQKLRSVLIEQLSGTEHKLDISDEKPFSILMIGINGSGKTTTTGKLAKKFQQQGLSVALAAGDTFRAAAVEQLQTWGERNNVSVVAQASGADPAAVIFDALESSKAKDIDVLIADTAGRLHTQDDLMEELKKVKRVMQKAHDKAPSATILVIDGSTGQNGLKQAKLFHEALGITGLVITKLDGTAKGGIVFAIHQELKLPIHYIGVGESIDDLREFEAENFVSALLNEDK